MVRKQNTSIVEKYAPDKPILTLNEFFTKSSLWFYLEDIGKYMYACLFTGIQRQTYRLVYVGVDKVRLIYVGVDKVRMIMMV